MDSTTRSNGSLWVTVVFLIQSRIGVLSVFAVLVIVYDTACSVV